MDIVLPGFDLESSIDGFWEKIQNQSQKQEMLKNKVGFIYLEDFQEDLNFALSFQLQTALNLNLNYGDSPSRESVKASFTYLEFDLVLARVWTDNIIYWHLFNKQTSQHVLCLPQELEQRLMLELAKIKHKSL